ncbi:12073_t:CDS:2 [Funneliformis geosporum]|uniref:18470_t:CDS:1 n=1 Tax=Funneliformis geosporum TaxID=1117311 RepID=A0A9W4SDF0_9GLOM|nr:12073_t:CDS:2 [Funneliformis geosporum]CAI2164889.1 18470_t:CDS:2 [Funneliformis geosporum]
MTTNYRLRAFLQLLNLAAGDVAQFIALGLLSESRDPSTCTRLPSAIIIPSIIEVIETNNLKDNKLMEYMHVEVNVKERRKNSRICLFSFSSLTNTNGSQAF